MPLYKQREVSPHDIVEGERARKDLGDLDSLAESIRAGGLIQPIAVSEEEDGTLLLRAGGRRLAASKKAGIQSIPALVFSGISDIDGALIELVENIHRKDMSWQEEATLVGRIHRLQVEKFGKASRGPGGGGWTLKATAELAGISLSYASRCLDLTDALEEQPELFEGAGGIKEAVNRLEDAKRTVIEEELAKRVERGLSQDAGDVNEADDEEVLDTGSSSPSKNKEGEERYRLRKLAESYVLGDFFEKAKVLPDESFDIIECDPPYGTSFDSYRKSGGIYSYKGDSVGKNKSDNYEEIKGDYGEFLGSLLPELYRLAKPHSWILLWFSTRHWELVRDALNEEGFLVAGQPIIWVKTYTPSVQPNRVLGNKYECCWYARKGEAVLNKTNGANVIYRENRGKRIHPAERPVELISELLSIFSPPRGRVLCPFAGSGNTLEAAFDLGLSGVGYDLSEYYRNRYIARLAGRDAGDDD